MWSGRSAKSPLRSRTRQIVRPNSRTVPAVTDSQDGNAQLEDLGIRLGRFRLINAGWTAGKYQSPRGQLADPRSGKIVPHQLTKDVGVADPPGDHLGCLAPKVQHPYALFMLRRTGVTLVCGG